MGTGTKIVGGTSTEDCKLGEWTNISGGLSAEDCKPIEESQVWKCLRGEHERDLRVGYCTIGEIGTVGSKNVVACKHCGCLYVWKGQ